MHYEQINSIQQFNFQINRVLTYGESACDMEEVRTKTAAIQNIAQWKRVWPSLAKTAKKQQQYLHTAYALRMAEFFLKSSDPHKEKLYQQCIAYFYKAFDKELHLTYQRYHIPFAQKLLNCIKIPTNKSLKGTVLVCGGYDSFIEEFVLQVCDFTQRGYDIILFEGPGQGECLRQNLYFSADFEHPTTAVLNFFQINKCAFVGISWGGYFALRSAAFEPRICAAAAYDVMDNGFEVMTNIFPAPICKIVRWAYLHKKEKFVNRFISIIRRKNLLADWAFSQGMYITGTNTPYAFYQNISQHTLHTICHQIRQDILLLAGEKDHYIPKIQFYRTKENLSNAKSVSYRLFTEAEGGAQHCQVGNHLLAVEEIAQWLDKYFADC